MDDGLTQRRERRDRGGTLPGVGLGEIGDDRERFTDARSLKDLRRFCADHAGLRAQHLDYPPRGEEQPTQRCRIPLGVRRDGESRRTPRPLTPRTRPRRSARRCASAPLRPLARAAPLLLANRSALRPDQGVRARSGRVLRDRGLTSWCDRRSSSARSRPISTPNSPRDAIAPSWPKPSGSRPRTHCGNGFKGC